MAKRLRKLSSPNTAEELEKLADRRSSRAAVRLCAGIFLLYQRATRARESDPFIRDDKSWSAFEQAAMPEMASFAFYDRSKYTARTPSSVLADAMGHIWMAEKLPNIAGKPTTIQLITELANHIASAYEISPIDRRNRKRASLGLNILG